MQILNLENLEGTKITAYNFEIPKFLTRRHPWCCIKAVPIYNVSNIFANFCMATLNKEIQLGYDGT